MQWKTAEGKVIAICEMTDAYLTNSMAMCLREKCGATSNQIMYKNE